MELFKLLGTIAIENGEAIKALKKAQDEGGKTESKLSKVFSSLGRGAAVAGKAIATGLAVGATAMAGLTVKALQLSGDLEQNMGGAEAVFGELGKTIGDMSAPMQKFNESTGQMEWHMESLETVSKEAYKNMGLSQSDYLATANKMGALFKGAGFETQEALDLSSQAMQRAADVASIMGIDTEAAMEAVAGAAKGNFTMMDNLGVAMNDTAIAAYAMEKGINKSTSEMTQQEKIGLAMEMFLEKTSYAAGNYAKENETLAGSLGTAKAALTNFLSGAGDVDSLVSSFSNLADVVIKSITEIAPRLTEGLVDIVQKLAQKLPELIQTLLPVLVEGAVTLVQGLVQALPSIVQAIMAALPSLIEGVVQLIQALAAALPQVIQPIVEALPGIVQQIVAALPQVVPQLVEGLVNAIVILCTNFSTIIQPLIDALPDLIIMIVEALVNNLPALIEGLITLILGIVAAIPQIIQGLVDAIPTVVSLLVQALLTNLPAIIAGLCQVVWGIVAALPQIFGSLIQGVANIFVGIWDGIKAVFAPIGEWFSSVWASLANVPGLAQLKTAVEKVWAAIKQHISTVLNAIKNVVSTAWNSIKNVVSTVLNAVKNVISTAWNAIKTVISNVMKVITSVLKGDWEGVKNAISNILNAIKSVISSIWNGIKSVISSVLNAIKSVVSSIWNGIKSVISSTMNTIKSVVSSAWNGIKSAISNILKGIVNTVKSAAKNMISAGKNLVEGIWQGISNGYSWITGKIKSWVGNVTKFIKKLFGIASPSKVMRDEVGRYLAEGIAVGIEQNTEAATTAMKDLGEAVLKQAKDNLNKEGKANEELSAEILSVAQEKLDTYKTYNTLTAEAEAEFWNNIRTQFTEGSKERVEADKKYFDARNEIDSELMEAAEKRLENYKVYNEMTIAEEVGFWDELRNKFEEGTDARIKADQKYFDAKKSLNEKLVEAEEELEASIADIYKKIEDKKSEYLNNFDLFKEYTEGNEKPASFMEMDSALNSQIKALEYYDSEMAALEEKIGGTALFEELSGLGLEGLSQIQEFNKLSDVQLAMYLEKYNKRNELADKMAKDDLETEFADLTTEAYTKFASTCDSLGVSIVGELSELVNGTIESFTVMTKEFAEILARSVVQHNTFAVSSSDDSASVKWYASAMDHAKILRQPTIFGYNPSSGKYLGGGEAGNEVVAGEQTLMNMIQTAVAEQNSETTSWMQRLFELIASYFPQMLGAMKAPIAFNADSMATTLAVPMNRELGRISSRKDRGR